MTVPAANSTGASSWHSGVFCSPFCTFFLRKLTQLERTVGSGRSFPRFPSLVFLLLTSLMLITETLTLTFSCCMWVLTGIWRDLCFSSQEVSNSSPPSAHFTVSQLVCSLKQTNRHRPGVQKAHAVHTARGLTNVTSLSQWSHCGLQGNKAPRERLFSAYVGMNDENPLFCVCMYSCVCVLNSVRG